jgi:hypothetical protein
LSCFIYFNYFLSFDFYYLGYAIFCSESGSIARLSIPLIQSLHGLSYTFFWVCIVKLGWKISPVSLKASSQAILSLCYGTLGKKWYHYSNKNEKFIQTIIYNYHVYVNYYHGNVNYYHGNVN